jgi:hypothetical protein
MIGEASRTEAPDYIDEVIGFRVLTFRAGGVYSPYRRAYRWYPTRTTEVATCEIPAHRPRYLSLPHDTPERFCSCGFYAFYGFDDAFGVMSAGGVVAGARQSRDYFEFVALVGGWGRVVLCESGYRSEYMRLIALHTGGEEQSRALARVARDLRIPRLGRGELIRHARSLPGSSITA